MDERTPHSPAVGELAATSGGLDLLVGLTIVVVGLLGLVAVWMYVLAPTLLR
jgi:hypothetical protein